MLSLIPARWRRTPDPDPDAGVVAYRRPCGPDLRRAIDWHAGPGLRYAGTPSRFLAELAVTYRDNGQPGAPLTEYGYGLLLIAHALAEVEADVRD